jgi:hypothetical protein
MPLLLSERGAHLDPRLPVHWANAHRHTIRRRESGRFISGGLRGFARKCWESGLTGNGLACKGDKDEERFYRALRQWVLPADRQSLQGSSLLHRAENGVARISSFPCSADLTAEYTAHLQGTDLCWPRSQYQI